MATKKHSSPEISCSLTILEFDGIVQDLEHIDNLAGLAFEAQDSAVQTAFTVIMERVKKIHEVLSVAEQRPSAKEVSHG